jgi:ethanolamine-phosphate cytidylyltransferase/choline-phosphate cytidylyltransferase
MRGGTGCRRNERMVMVGTRKTVRVYADVVCDLFHAGHVEFFRRARALADELIVGVVADADVATYKPEPIMSFAERLAVVRACRLVDRVLDEPAPLHCSCAFLDRIGADFACHGDDLAADAIAFWYGDLIPAGRIRTVPYTRGISSREIVRRVAARNGCRATDAGG